MFNTTNDVIEFACALEKRAQNFYKSLARSTEHVEVKNLALKLSIWEEEHETTLKSLLVNQKNKKLNNSDNQLIKSVEVIAADKIFNDKWDKYLQSKPDIKDILVRSLEMERKMILVFRALQQLYQGLDNGYFLRLIGEETQHIDYINKRITEL
jgi:rubrerythrin